jgi:hypothetical protein
MMKSRRRPFQRWGSSRSCGWLAAPLAVAILILLPAAAAASPPANDDFADAEDIGALPATVSGDNTGATTETGEPAVLGPYGSVWFKWTATSSGPVHIDLCDSADPQPFFGVYTGTELSNLQRVTANSFWADGGDCAGIFDAVAGTTYYISVDRFPVGGAITLALREADPPPNDDFAGAQTVGPTLPVLFVGSTLDASAEPGEPIHEYSAAPTKSLWYRWVAPYTGEANFESGCSGPLYDGIPISVYTGTALDNLVQVGATACYQTLNVTAGTTYWIAPNAYWEGTFAFRIENNVDGYFPSPNDNFGNARVIPSGLARSLPGSTIYTSYEDDEPDAVEGLPADASVWFRWTAATTGPVAIDTCLSDFDTLLGVFQGSSLTTLTRVTSNDDASECDTRSTNPYGSRTVIDAVAGHEYRIAVDAFDAYDWGDFFLNLTAAGPQIEPPPSAIPSTPHRKTCKKHKRRHANTQAAGKRCKKKRGSKRGR